jgi:mono/diheme cytochrome c family protein
MSRARRTSVAAALAALLATASACGQRPSDAKDAAATAPATATSASPAATAPPAVNAPPAATAPAVATAAASSAPAAAAPAPPPAPYPVEIGRDVYRRYCMTCHGETGAGDGFNAFNLDPHPRDFNDPALLKKTDAEVRDAIRRGGGGVGLSPLMPPWGRTLNERQIDDLVLYLKTLRKPPA